jgi:predicted dinucleotide-binding enzyme
MRICIFGAGAVGSHFAVRLALAGRDVSCVMRGPHLEAVKAKGLTLRVGVAEFSAHVRASDDPAALGPQDFVFSMLKATGLSSLATGLPPLLRDDTAIVFAQNGLPWWYDHLAFLDPGGRLRTAIPKKRIIGGVIFSSNEIVAPDLVVNDSPERNMLLVGECDDRSSERIQRLRTALEGALIQSPRVPPHPGGDLDQADQQHVGVGAVYAHREKRTRRRWTPRCTMSCRACSMRRSRLPAFVTVTSRAEAEPRPITDLCCCKITSAVVRWKSMRWSGRPGIRQDRGIIYATLDVLAALAMCRARDRGLYVD